MYGSRCESVGILWYNWTVILPPASSHKSSDGTVIIFKWRYYKQTHSQMYAINKPFLLTFFFYSIWFFDISLVLKKHFPLKYKSTILFKEREVGIEWMLFSEGPVLCQRIPVGAIAWPAPVVCWPCRSSVPALCPLHTWTAQWPQSPTTLALKTK